jgi:hypothetical protein
LCCRASFRVAGRVGSLGSLEYQAKCPGTIGVGARGVGGAAQIINGVAGAIRGGSVVAAR